MNIVIQGKSGNSTGSTNKRPGYIIYICIALVVIAFNLIAIFGPNVLFSDDNIAYNDVIEGRFPNYFLKHSPIYTLEIWMNWNIMAFSTHLARVIHLLLLMIPLSCCFYYLFYNKFGFSRYAAAAAAILPNILPYHWKIPAGVVPSYTLWGLLFAVFSLIIGFHYLEKNTPKNWLRLLGAITCYFFSTQLMEQSIFIFPPLAFAFLGFTKLNKKHIWLISSFFILALGKFIWVMSVPRYAPRDIPIKEMLKRVGLYFQWSLPYKGIEPGYLITFFVVVILAGFILFIKNDNSISALINKNFLHMKKKIYVLYFYALFIGWSVSSIIVFICIGDFWIRYTHISSFGLNAIFIFSLFVILNRGIFKKYKLHIFVFTGIIVFSGVARYLHLKRVYTTANHTQSIIIRDLNKQELPLNSQVVIAGVRELSPGWEGASGYLKFALKRNDINGLVGRTNASAYYNFDNHFNPEERRWGNRYLMTGLSIDRPTFLFFMLKEQEKLKQLEYALQWKGKTRRAPWTVLKFNKENGDISSFISGSGMKEYLLTLKDLKKKGIYQSDILWGGPPTKKERARLGRLELDPKFLRGGILYNQLGKIEASRARHFIWIAKRIAPISGNIYFGDKFRLMLLLPDEVTNEDGSVSKILHLLWKSREKQRLDQHRLAITFLKGQEQIGGVWPKCCLTALELDAGDFLFGSIKIPPAKFNEAEYIGIRVYTLGPPEWTSLKIRGDHKTNQNGFRLLLPIVNVN